MAFAVAAIAHSIPDRAAVAAYAYAWLENQVMAAIKTVPLGQVAGQRLLAALGASLPRVVDSACSTADGDLRSFAPGLSLASCRHETQYTRLFRS